MNMINHILVAKMEEEKISKEVARNYSIIDEISDLVMNIEFTREVIEENLMFDYFIREEEANYLMFMCDKTQVDYKELTKMIKMESIKYLREYISVEEISKTTWSDVANNLIRIHKKLILSKIEKKYQSLYSMVLVRAKKTTEKIIRGIN